MFTVRCPNYRQLIIACLLFFLLHTPGYAERSNAWTVVRQFVINGKTVPAQEAELRLAPRVDRLQVDLDVTERCVRKGYRLQYMLEGVDKSWQQFNGNMTLYFRWKDEQQNLVDLKGFAADGKSDGWESDWQTAPLITQRQRISVPPAAHELEIQLTSGNGPVVGILLLDNLKITVEETGEVLFTDDFESETSLKTWEAGGLKKGMASIVSRQMDGTPENRLLSIFDDNASAYAVWSCILPFKEKHLAGKTLIVEWQQAHSIGRCSPGSFNYVNLPAGDWHLKLRRTHPLTEVPIPDTEMDFSITVPALLWKRTWFQLTCCLTLIALFALASFVIVRLKWKRQLAETERQRMLEAERIRIARDIHDEIGHRLTFIGILAQGLNQQTCEDVGRSICKATQDTVLNMSEIVWTVNPQNDNLENLVGFLSRFAREFLKNTSTQAEITIPMTIPQTAISTDTRRQILMLLKETLNNSVKHASCSRINLAIGFSNQTLIMDVADNGVGFDKAALPNTVGNGLRNMAARVQALNGRWSIQSNPGEGTSLHFEIPFRQKPS